MDTYGFVKHHIYQLFIQLNRWMITWNLNENEDGLTCKSIFFVDWSVNDDSEGGVIENNLSSLEKQRRSSLLKEDFYSKNAKDASDILIEAIEFLLDNDISSNDLNNENH